MKSNRIIVYSLIFFLFIGFISACNKSRHRHNDDDAPINPVGALRTVKYSIVGTNFQINYIDSNTIYKSNEVYKDSFVYEFKKGSGAGIGLTVAKQSSSDTIYSWRITIDDVLYANAFSDGGAFFTVPYK